MKDNHLHILITGGTIDSIFDPKADSIIVSDSTVVAAYLTNVVKAHFTISQEIVCLKDSRQMSDATRHDILHAIKRSPSPYVLITHGTYTMGETATFLSQHLNEIPEARVFLTGAFYPLSGFANGDAPFNLGFAIASCFNAAPGVYISMNGKTFQANEVTKNLKSARFE